MTRLTGRHVLFLLLGFFGVIFAANAAFIYLALDSFSGLSTENSYVKGLAYNDTLEAGRAQQALGWRTDISARLLADGGRAEIEVAVRGADGGPVGGLDFAAVLRRPVEAKDDQTLVFAEAADGRYLAIAEGVRAGNWLLLLDTTAANGTPVRLETRLWLKSSN